MPSPKSARQPVGRYERVRRLALALPGVEDGTSYGTPALKVRGKVLARLRDEDGALVIKVGTMMERDFLLAHESDVFFITKHYREYPSVLVRLDVVSESTMIELLEAAWRRAAPKKLIAEYDALKTAAQVLTTQ